MKATILLGTLKMEGLSNTETLVEFLSSYLEKQDVIIETIKLVNKNILPGTYSDMGEGDGWPPILEKLVQSDIIIFATPVWWGSQSSETQRVLERLDEIYDLIEQGEKSPLEDKCGGILITGDSDGAQNIIGNLCNFMGSIGVLVPPYCALPVIWSRHSKDSKITRKQLLEKYDKEYAEDAETMAKTLVSFAKKLKK